MKIKAAVLREFKKPLKIEELELADPKEKEVLVKVLACGICHSDVHIVVDEVPAPLPIILGHEMFGEVEKVGPKVTRIKPGDRVIGTWMVHCGECFQCLNGRPNLCEKYQPKVASGKLLDDTSRLTDKQGNMVNHGLFVTGWSTHTVIPESGAIPIPPHIKLPPEHLCQLGCSVPTGWGVVANVANAKVGTSIAIYGCGAIGLNAIRSAALRQATPIIAIDLEESKKDLAMEMGATHFINSSKEDPVPRIQDLTGGAGVEYAIEAIGDPGAIIQAWWSIRMGGSVIIPGLTPVQETTNLPLLLLPLHGKKIIGTLYGEVKLAEDIPRLMELMATGALKTDKLITRKMKLEDINEAVQAMLERKIKGRWVMMME